MINAAILNYFMMEPTESAASFGFVVLSWFSSLFGSQTSSFTLLLHPYLTGSCFQSKKRVKYLLREVLETKNSSIRR